MTARWRQWRRLCALLAADYAYGRKISDTRYAELRQRARSAS